MQQPEVILFCSGGIVQSISTNIADLKVYYLDEDIFEDSKLEREENEFQERLYVGIDDTKTNPRWEQFKEDAEREWNQKLISLTDK